MPILLDRTSKIIYIRDKVRPTDPSPGCGFAIETPSRTYILAAGSTPERDKWAIDIQMALSVLYGLPKPVTLARSEAPASAVADQPQQPPAVAPLTHQPSATSLPSASTPASNGGPAKPSPRYSMAYSEVPIRQSVVDVGPSGGVDGAVIEDYNSESEARRGTSQNLLSMAKSGLNSLNPISGASGFSGRGTLLGRKDEVEMLKEELVRKDRQLELTERKLKVLDSAYADMSEKYFVSVAVFAKMNATTEGYYCNIDVYQLYSEAQRMNIDPHEWPQWITQEIQKNATRMRN